jgi:hypothetical protein
VRASVVQVAEGWNVGCWTVAAEGAGTAAFVEASRGEPSPKAHPGLTRLRANFCYLGQVGYCMNS